MNISTDMIVSNSDMIKNYKNCREMAEKYGRIFILKNNQPDAILFSAASYERIAAFLEYLESLDQEDAAKLLDSLPKEGARKRYSIDQIKTDIE